MELAINRKLLNPDDIFDSCQDTVECIKVAQRDAVEVVLSALPHTKWPDVDMNNREQVRKQLFKMIKES